MIKKIRLSVFLAVLFGLLLWGAVNRTIAITAKSEPLSLAKADGQAAESEWLTKNGWVDSVNDSIWIITLSDGESLELKGRKVTFMIEQGFVVAVNDNLFMKGFLEGADFEVASIVNETTGQTVSIRDQTGQPLWAGNQSGRK